MEIVIVPDLCIGCTLCAVICPQRVLDVRSEVMAVVVDIDKCNRCMKCEQECPEKAITVKE